MLRKILTHPVTHFNLLLVGFFILIQGVHLYAHYQMKIDVNGYVHKYLKKNPNACSKFDY
jgi:hypothetical protein